MTKTIIAFAFAALFAGHALAGNEAPASVIEKFKAMYPNTTFKEIRKSQVSGLYEVVMGSNIAYTDESGRYFIFGHLFDMQEQVDLTAQRQLDAQKTEFPSKYLGNAIKTVKGNGKRVVAVFADPNCHYCKELEGELARLDNVTIYTFLYPVLGDDSATKAKAIWCAADRAKAWTNQMVAGKGPKLVSCDNPVNDNLTLGSRLGVTGTPTLIAVDGRVLPGSAPAEKIDQWLDAAAPRQQGASQ